MHYVTECVDARVIQVGEAKIPLIDVYTYLRFHDVCLDP
jgi:hypothetical protein